VGVAGFVLCLLGGTFTLLVAVLFLARRDEEKTAQRIAQTPQTPAARAPDGGIAEIVGIIHPSEQGLLRTPSGRAAVLYRTHVTVSGGKHRHDVMLVRDRRAFYVDDGSGQRARVEPIEGVPAIASAHVYGGTGHNAAIVVGGTPTTYGPITPELHAWLATYVPPQHFNDTLRVEELVLAPGDRVYVIGPCRWENGEPVLRHHGDGDRELLLSNLDEQAIVSLFATRRRTRFILLGISIGFIAVGAMFAAGELLL
jgi:hypothetical protein